MNDAASLAPYPDGIGERNVRPVAAWLRHASPLGLVAFGAVVALALTGLLGHERTWVGEGNGARVEVHAPEVIRNGEFFELLIRVEADAPIGELVIGVEEALWTDVTINSMVPAPAEEASADGRYAFTFAELPAGTSFLLKVDGQVNPDIVGGNAGTIGVSDGERLLTSVPVEMSVLP